MTAPDGAVGGALQRAVEALRGQINPANGRWSTKLSEEQANVILAALRQREDAVAAERERLLEPIIEMWKASLFLPEMALVGGDESYQRWRTAYERVRAIGQRWASDDPTRNATAIRSRRAAANGGGDAGQG